LEAKLGGFEIAYGIFTGAAQVVDSFILDLMRLWLVACAPATVPEAIPPSRKS
jgi:hypothetical protein